ncbi:TRAP transporter permease [Vogesella oryzae]|uniref:TRAP transporter permease n=1 Tax=Vogesella oryzae TaxID=1735285 RepID=UPI001582F501|nr:TRAP transporter permease [Vogesella oryzae]
MSDSQHGGSLPRSVLLAALLFSVFQIVTAAFSPLSSSVVRALHVGFLLLLVFQLYDVRGRRGSGGWSGYLLAAAGFGLAFYHWVFEGALIQRAGEMTTLDMGIGIATLLLVFEAARRVMGVALPVICLLFFGYATFGEYLPGELAHRGFGFDQIIGQLAFGTEGIYGTPTYVSSGYIFLFILFGAFLEQAGMIRLFNDFALGTVGHTRGGPAKVAVISSGLMGTINGSGVANVVTTGQFTIPLMKKFGYKADFAGAVEATSSMGGQIMPPVMGAVAFIMAETINVPYVEICKAALVPAVLYFFTVFWMVHLEAGRAGLLGLKKSDCPDPWRALKEQWYLLLPLAGLVYLLFAGFTPLFSGMMGLVLTVILIFGSALALRIRGTALRVLFWLGLGLVTAGFAKGGIVVPMALIALLAGVLLLVREGRPVLKTAYTALIDGAMHALPVGIACALVGVIIGSITLTGVATTFAGYVVQLGSHSLFLSLVLTMLTCLVLGMGIPTIPNYIITSAIAAPALLDLGVPLIVSHMFVFYFGIMADLTPPVALAAFAAAPIARESGLKIGIRAMQIAIAGFIVPYMAVYAPALMWQFNGEADWLAAAFAFGKALLAVSLWGVVTIGFWQRKLLLAERVLAFVAACLLVVAVPFTDELGLAGAAAFAGWHLYRHRRQPAMQGV